MWKLLSQKCRVFVDQGVLPCLESIVCSCTQLQSNWFRAEVEAPLAGAGVVGGGAVNTSSVLRLQVRNYSQKAPPHPAPSPENNCGAPKECNAEEKKGTKSCGPSHFKGNICDMVKGKKKDEKPKGEKAEKPTAAKKHTSMWDVPGCEYVPKCDLPIRLDIAFYRTTDKQARDYQVTWTECPRLIIKPKKVCIHQKHRRPKICRRQRKNAAATARPSMPMVNPMKCKENKMDTSCPRWTMPCCKPAKIPPSCSRARVLTQCKKRYAPYPSFSECLKDEFIELPPTECKCRVVPMSCEVWAEVRRRIARGKEVLPKCGKF